MGSTWQTFDVLFRTQNHIQLFLQIIFPSCCSLSLSSPSPRQHSDNSRIPDYLNISLLFFSSVCLKGIKIHDKCFLADPLKKRYHTASEDCNALGGVLGTPTSSDENDQLRDYIRQRLGPDEQVWLGVNDMMTEGTWKDQTGSSIRYKNWDTSNSRSPQPDGGQSQNCVVLSGASRGKWSDEDCRNEKPSVCQFNIV